MRYELAWTCDFYLRYNRYHVLDERFFFAGVSLTFHIVTCTVVGHKLPELSNKRVISEILNEIRR